jgi:hypothetical protein
MVHPALLAAENLDLTVANMRFIKPLDKELVIRLAQSHDALVCVEEGCVMGGAGSAVMKHWPKPVSPTGAIAGLCRISSLTMAILRSCWQIAVWMPKGLPLRYSNASAIC